jgi:hypothetical protein
LVAGWLAVSLAGPVGASLRNPAPSLDADRAPASTTFGDRRISVPSAGHYYGATFQAMTVDGAHVFLQSGSDLTIDPAEDRQGTGGGYFDFVANRVLRVNCPCLNIAGSTADGSAIVGSSLAKLVPSDLDTSEDLYLFDASGPHPISSGTDGYPKFVAITSDGSAVLFTIGISLTAADVDTTRDLYRWSRATGTVDLISTGNADPTFVAMSPDASRILYSLDPALKFTYLWANGSSTFLAAGGFVTASPDLSRVYLNTSAALDPADQDTLYDGYRFDSSGSHVMTEPSTHYSGLVAVKGDGTAWAMYSNEQLTTDDHDNTVDFFLRTASSIVLLSRGDLAAQDLRMDAAFTSGVYYTLSRLDPADTDDWDDVYRWTAAAPDSPQLLSGVGVPDVHIAAYSPDGSRTLMSTTAPLVPGDTDSFIDLYEFVDGSLRLALPGQQDYTVGAWTPDLKRIVVVAGQLTSEDTNGNVADVYVSDADLTPPTLEVTGPAGISGASAQVSFDTAAGDGIWFDCQLDGGSWNQCVSPLTVGPLSAGSHDVTVRAYDPAGNSAEESVQWTAEPPPPDLAAPVGTISIAGGQAWTPSTSVTLAVPASDASGVAEVALSNDGTTWTTSPYAATQPWILSATDGPKTVWVRWRDAPGNWSNPASDTIVLDTVPPSGTVSIAGGAATTGTTSVAVAIPATDATSGVSQVAISNDDSSWTTQGYATTAAWILTPGNGIKTVWVKWQDGAGNWSNPASDTIDLVTTVPDTIAPVATAPTKAFVLGSSLTSGRPTFRFAWSGSDVGSGVHHYEFGLSTDGGAYSTLAGALSTPTFDRALAAGHSYRARVRAIDVAGNVGAWAYGSAFRLTAYQESSSAVHWSGTWRTGSSTSFWGGHDRYASAAGAKASLTFSGRSFAWVGSVGQSRGWAKVYVNGVLVKSVNLNAAANANRRILFATTWSTARSRTITIRISGTAGHPRGDVDAFLTGS